MDPMTGPGAPGTGTRPTMSTSRALPGLLEELRRTGRIVSPPSRRSRMGSVALLLVAVLAAAGAVGTCIRGILGGSLEDAIGGGIGSVFMGLFVLVAAHGLWIKRKEGPLTLTLSATGISVGVRTFRWDEITAVRAQRLQVPAALSPPVPAFGRLAARGPCLAISLSDECVARLRAASPGSAVDRVLLPGNTLQIGMGGTISPEDLAVLAAEARTLRWPA